MPSLNSKLTQVRSDSIGIELKIKKLLSDYEGIYKEANREFQIERADNGSMDGIEDFYHLTNILRRNRDVVSSVTRAFRNLRSTEKYSFVEEDINPVPAQEKKPARAKKPPKKQKKAPSSVPQINQEELSNLEITQ